MKAVTRVHSDFRNGTILPMLVALLCAAALLMVCAAAIIVRPI